MSQAYPGRELELFAGARRWKAYLRGLLRAHLVGDVLEVGAGIGATTGALCDGSQRTWLCLEPDPVLARQIEDAVAAGRLPACCRVVAGRVGDLPSGPRFDTMLYIDVLEHIEADGAELTTAVTRLRPGGTLAVLAPAHRWLFSPFDAAIGHHRRYTRASLAQAAPPALRPLGVRYLDSAGLVASLANRLALRQTLPTARQIALWDRWLVPLSRRLDPLLGFRIGKSVLGIWQAPPAPAGPAVETARSGAGRG